MSIIIIDGALLQQRLQVLAGECAGAVMSAPDARNVEMPGEALIRAVDGAMADIRAMGADTTLPVESEDQPQDEFRLQGLEVVRLLQTCFACPAQWSAWLGDDTELYVRYRGGWLSVHVGGADGRQVFRRQIGDSFDGVMTWEEVELHTGLTHRVAL